jgi:cytochrome d ubiquinol oxidase subunit II
MELTTVWFILIAVLWTGYFFLEGFDFGVGMLLHPLGRTETDRRVMINTIGPVWDGNEVWLLTAGGATFAAFPDWYATLFSGFYLPLFLILVALILRGVAFEYRGKVDSDGWRKRWDLAIAFGSWVPAVLWGVAFANIVAGVPIDAERRLHRHAAHAAQPLRVARRGGHRLAVRCSTAPTSWRSRPRARCTTPPVGWACASRPVTVVAGAVFLVWNQVERGAGPGRGPLWLSPRSPWWPRWSRPGPTVTAGRSPPPGSPSPRP